MPADEIIPSFEIRATGPVSRAFLDFGKSTFAEAATHVRALPYGRTSKPDQVFLVLDEGRGTCSSKHAVLATLSREIGEPLPLMLGIYLMDGDNTPGVGRVLAANALQAIPEAHCYLKYQNQRLDFTRSENPIIPQLEFLQEEQIEPYQATGYKTERHKDYIREWTEAQSLKKSLEEVWCVRERCIAALAEG